MLSQESLARHLFDTNYKKVFFRLIPVRLGCSIGNNEIPVKWNSFARGLKCQPQVQQALAVTQLPYTGFLFSHLEHESNSRAEGQNNDLQELAKNTVRLSYNSILRYRSTCPKMQLDFITCILKSLNKGSYKYMNNTNMSESRKDKPVRHLCYKVVAVPNEYNLQRQFNYKNGAKYANLGREIKQKIE